MMCVRFMVSTPKNLLNFAALLFCYRQWNHRKASNMTTCTRSTSRAGVNAASFSGFAAFFYSVEYALNMDKAEKHTTSADISNRATWKPLMAYAKDEREVNACAR